MLMPGNSIDDVPEDVETYARTQLEEFFENRDEPTSSDCEIVVLYQTTRGQSLIGPQLFHDLGNTFSEQTWNISDDIRVLPTYGLVDTVPDPFDRDLDVIRIILEHRQFAVCTGRDNLPTGNLENLRSTVLEVLQSNPQTDQEQRNEERFENPNDCAIVTENTRCIA